MEMILHGQRIADNGDVRLITRHTWRLTKSDHRFSDAGSKIARVQSYDCNGLSSGQAKSFMRVFTRSLCRLGGEPLGSREVCYPVQARPQQLGQDD